MPHVRNACDARAPEAVRESDLLRRAAVRTMQRPCRTRATVLARQNPFHLFAPHALRPLWNATYTEDLEARSNRLRLQEYLQPHSASARRPREEVCCLPAAILRLASLPPRHKDGMRLTRSDTNSGALPAAAEHPRRPD